MKPTEYKSEYKDKYQARDQSQGMKKPGSDVHHKDRDINQGTNQSQSGLKDKNIGKKPFDNATNNKPTRDDLSKKR